MDRKRDGPVNGSGCLGREGEGEVVVGEGLKGKIVV